MKYLILALSVLIIPGCLDLPQVDTSRQSQTIVERDNKIIMYTMRACFWCDKQKAELEKAEGYAVEYRNAVEDAKTLVDWGIPPFVPVTVVVQDGEPVKVFHGYTPWEEIKPHAESAQL